MSALDPHAPLGPPDPHAPVAQAVGAPLPVAGAGAPPPASLSQSAHQINAAVNPVANTLPPLPKGPRPPKPIKQAAQINLNPVGSGAGAQVPGQVVADLRADDLADTALAAKIKDNLKKMQHKGKVEKVADKVADAAASAGTTATTSIMYAAFGGLVSFGLMTSFLSLVLSLVTGGHFVLLDQSAFTQLATVVGICVVGVTLAAAYKMYQARRKEAVDRYKELDDLYNGKDAATSQGKIDSRRRYWAFASTFAPSESERINLMSNIKFYAMWKMDTALKEMENAVDFVENAAPNAPRDHERARTQWSKEFETLTRELARDDTLRALPQANRPAGREFRVLSDTERQAKETRKTELQHKLTKTPIDKNSYEGSNKNFYGGFKVLTEQMSLIGGMEPPIFASQDKASIELLRINSYDAYMREHFPQLRKDKTVPLRGDVDVELQAMDKNKRKNSVADADDDDEAVVDPKIGQRVGAQAQQLQQALNNVQKGANGIVNQAGRAVNSVRNLSNPQSPPVSPPPATPPTPPKISQIEDDGSGIGNMDDVD